MDSLPLLVIALICQTAIVALQVGDSVTLFLDARRVRESADPEVLKLSTLRQLTWAVAFAAISAVLLAFGVDVAARSLIEFDRPVFSYALLVLLSLLVFGVGLLAVFVAVRRRPSYLRIRRDLRDRAKLRLDPEEITAFDARLAEADKLRERRGAAEPMLRLLALLVVLALAIPSLFIGFSEAVFLLAATAIGVSALSVFAFLLAVRASGVRSSAIEAIYAAQRAEVVALLEHARIPQQKSVPGLRDRVSRALAILREHQR